MSEKKTKKRKKVSAKRTKRGKGLSDLKIEGAIQRLKQISISVSDGKKAREQANEVLLDLIGNRRVRNAYNLSTSV